MLVASAEEPILQHSSSSFLAFVLCNLIVLAILLGSRLAGPSGSGTGDCLPAFGGFRGVEWPVVVPVERLPSSDDHVVCQSCRKEKSEEMAGPAEVAIVCEVEVGREEWEEDDCREWGQVEENGEEDCCHDEEVEEDDIGGCNDEFRRRIEEFIAKVNREREEENLKEGMHGVALLDEPLALVGISANDPC